MALSPACFVLTYRFLANMPAILFIASNLAENALNQSLTQ